jgi:hypothetical protein
MDGLFEIACDFRREDFGIMAIRQGSVVSDLEHCDQVILMSERTLNVLIRRLENFAALGLPRTTESTNFILSRAERLRDQLAKRFPSEWRHERRGQARWAAKLSLKDLENKFVRQFESYLRRCLHPLGLSSKKQDEYVNAVIAGVLPLNDPRTRRTDIRDTALSRARQARYNARRSGSRPGRPSDISEDELLR